MDVSYNLLKVAKCWRYPVITIKLLYYYYTKLLKWGLKQNAFSKLKFKTRLGILKLKKKHFK